MAPFAFEFGRHYHSAKAGIRVAHFFKAEGMSGAGYDLALTKQSLRPDEASLIALYGGDSDGSRLTVSPNNAGVIELREARPILSKKYLFIPR